MLPDITAFVTYIIKAFGYVGIGGIVFAESGLLLGFILPGDSLIFLVGLLASQGYFNLTALILVIFFTGVAGDNVGYLLGRKLGHKVFEKRDSFIFNQENLERTEKFFEQYGKLAFIIERFLPVVRAFVPLLAGVGKMRYITFFVYDLIGNALWSVGLTLLGFYIGGVIPNADTYILPIVLFIVVLSLVPTFITYRKRFKK
jgi:membrane-associated protein